MVLPLAMGWRHLLFENWPVEPAVMDAHLPDALTPDTYDGSAWLSVVPFTNVAVRPNGLPASLGIRLPELNVRTYVTRDGVPSVYFFGLDAQGVASVLGARLFHHLPYYRRSRPSASGLDPEAVHTEAQDGSLRYTDVDHDPWTLYPAAADIEANTLLSAHGFARPDAEPVYYYSPGLDVVASRSKRVRD